MYIGLYIYIYIHVYIGLHYIYHVKFYVQNHSRSSLERLSAGLVVSKLFHEMIVVKRSCNVTFDGDNTEIR